MIDKAIGELKASMQFHSTFFDKLKFTQAEISRLNKKNCLKKRLFEKGIENLLRRYRRIVAEEGNFEDTRQFCARFYHRP